MVRVLPLPPNAIALTGTRPVLEDAALSVRLPAGLSGSSTLTNTWPVMSVTHAPPAAIASVGGWLGRSVGVLVGVAEGGTRVLVGVSVGVAVFVGVLVGGTAVLVSVGVAVSVGVLVGV